MVTGTAPSIPPPPAPRHPSRYDAGWAAVAKMAVAGSACVAVLQSPRLPLLGLTAALGALGGLVLLGSSSTARRTWRELWCTTLVVAVATLAVVGAGHHLAIALAVVAVLLASSPDVLRWVSGR